MSNSAHDPITVLQEDATREDIPDDIQYRVYELVKKMQKDEEKGAAIFLRHRFRFRVTGNHSTLDFECVLDDVLESNWLGSVNEEVNVLTDADFKAIENGDYEITIEEKPKNAKKISYKELFEYMDDFKGGRPSSVSNIFKALREKSQLLHTDLATDQITLSQKGRDVLNHLRSEFGDLATVAWNSMFINKLEAIARGSESPENVLKELFIELFGKDNLHHIEGLPWNDPNVLYEIEAVANQFPGARLAPELSIQDTYIENENK